MAGPPDGAASGFRECRHCLRLRLTRLCGSPLAMSVFEDESKGGSKDLAHSRECSPSHGATVKGSDPDSATHWEGGFEQVSLPLSVFISSSMKMRKLYVPHSVRNIERDDVGYYYYF